MKFLKNLRSLVVRGSDQTAVRGAILMLFLGSLAGLWPAFLNRVLFDRTIPERDRSLILPVLAAVLLLEVVGAWCRRGADRYLAIINRGGRYTERVRQSLLVWSRRSPWFHRLGPGAAIRYHTDAGRIGEARACFIRRIVGPCLTLLLLLPGMFLISPALTACRFLPILPVALAGSGFLRRDLALEKLSWIEERGLAGMLTRGFDGADDLLIMDRTRDYCRRLRSRFHRIGIIELRRDRLRADWEAVGTGLTRIGSSLAPVVAAGLILSDRLSFGSFIAFSILAGRSLGAVGELTSGMRILARTGNALARRREIEVGADGSAIHPAHYIGGSRRTGRGLECRNLWFSYPGRQTESRPVFRGASFGIDEGEWVGIRGDNGSGKSTLFSLVYGFLRPEKGRLTWRGGGLESLPEHRRCSCVGGVSQHPVFFGGTVRENLTLFAPSPGKKAIITALEAVDALEMVMALPAGLDSPFPAGGKGLSGGERQRLALARLLLEAPPLILLDEPFSALTEPAAIRMAHALKTELRNRTVLIVHHGGGSILPLDRCLHLEGGLVL